MKNVNYHLSMSLKKSPSLKFMRRWIKISERQDSLSPNCSRSCCTLANFLKSPTYPDQIPSQHKLPRSTLTRPLIPLETSQMFPSTSLNQTGTGISHHNNVLAQYPWIDTKLIDDIALGSFNISSLPKLHREEKFRNQHIAKSAIEGDALFQYAVPLVPLLEDVVGSLGCHLEPEKPREAQGLAIWD